MTYLPRAKSLADYISMRLAPTEAGCIEWCGRYDGITPTGIYQAKKFNVRRVIKGIDDRRMVIFPKCENFKCVNENHMGVAPTLRPPVPEQPNGFRADGQMRWGSVLTEEKRQVAVAALRAGVSQFTIAAAISVSQSTVSRLARDMEKLK